MESRLRLLAVRLGRSPSAGDARSPRLIRKRAMSNAVLGCAGSAYGWNSPASAGDVHSANSQRQPSSNRRHEARPVLF